MCFANDNYCVSVCICTMKRKTFIVKSIAAKLIAPAPSAYRPPPPCRHCRSSLEPYPVIIRRLSPPSNLLKTPQRMSTLPPLCLLPPPGHPRRRPLRNMTAVHDEVMITEKLPGTQLIGQVGIKSCRSSVYECIELNFRASVELYILVWDQRRFSNTVTSRKAIRIYM